MLTHSYECILKFKSIIGPLYHTFSYEESDVTIHLTKSFRANFSELTYNMVIWVDCDLYRGDRDAMKYINISS